MATNGKVTVNVGDSITIEAKGIRVTGKVYSVDFWGGNDGWYIELVNANVPGGYSYWKQGFDGGSIVELNGKSLVKYYMINHNRDYTLGHIFECNETDIRNNANNVVLNNVLENYTVVVPISDVVQITKSEYDRAIGACKV